MKISYFKRFKMEADLEILPAVPLLPSGYTFVPWDEPLLDHHAEVKFLCFQDEIDATVFPSLGSRPGCRCLMSEIRRKVGFLPQATWLLAHDDEYVGTVQGVAERGQLGAIQNLGVVPAHRGQGFGRALLLQAMHGFRQAGLARAFLEVTAQNESAVMLYRRLGFRSRKTVYKAVETAGVI